MSDLWILLLFCFNSAFFLFTGHWITMKAYHRNFRLFTMNKDKNKAKGTGSLNGSARSPDAVVPEWGKD